MSVSILVVETKPRQPLDRKIFRFSFHPQKRAGVETVIPAPELKPARLRAEGAGMRLFVKPDLTYEAAR